jgi:phenylpyruvate tautomerase PptA (4-oxalocrotonate tautomerase family)
MPLIQVTTTETVGEKRKSLLQKLSHVVAEGTGRPEAFMMVVVQERAAMMVAGAEGPAAFVDVRSIGGLSPQICSALSERVCALSSSRSSRYRASVSI